MVDSVGLVAALEAEFVVWGQHHQLVNKNVKVNPHFSPFRQILCLVNLRINCHEVGGITQSFFGTGVILIDNDVQNTFGEWKKRMVA